MRQFQNYVIASQTNNEAPEGHTLCRLRPVDFDKQALFRERSQIKGCSAILQYCEASQKFFGFDSLRKAFVVFSLEALRPFQFDCEIYDIV